MLSQWYCLDYVIAVPQCLGGGFGRSIKQLNATPPWCPLWIIGAARAPSTPPNHTQALTFRWLARAALRMEHADRPAGGSETVFTSNNLNFKLFSGGRSMRTAVDVPLAQDESRYGIVPETDAEAAAAMQRANGIQANIATQSAQSTGAQPSKAQSSSSCFASVIKDERLVTRAHSVQLSFLEARRSISEGNDRAIMITAARSQSPSSSFNPASRVSHSHFNSYDMTDRRRGGGTNSILSRPIFRKSSDESLGSASSFVAFDGKQRDNVRDRGHDPQIQLSIRRHIQAVAPQDWVDYAWSSHAPTRRITDLRGPLIAPILDDRRRATETRGTWGTFDPFQTFYKARSTTNDVLSTKGSVAEFSNLTACKCSSMDETNVKESLFIAGLIATAINEAGQLWTHHGMYPSGSHSLSRQLASIPLGAWESQTTILDSLIHETVRIAQLYTAMRRNLGPDVTIDGKTITSGAYIAYPFSDVRLNQELTALFGYVGWGRSRLCYYLRS
ncbi:hypothetical protein BDR06DRAFT_1037838 [Suillus hirtellus]|nr:hypothetical protein BDR06DRAFT_1037838 [Suillus hirtellus]